MAGKKLRNIMIAAVGIAGAMGLVLGTAYAADEDQGTADRIAAVRETTEISVWTKDASKALEVVEVISGDLEEKTSGAAEKTSEEAGETADVAEETSEEAEETSDVTDETSEEAEETSKDSSEASEGTEGTSEDSGETSEGTEESPESAEETSEVAKEPSADNNEASEGDEAFGNIDGMEEPKALVLSEKLAVTEPIVLRELYSDEWYTTASPGMKFEDLPKPENAIFFPKDAVGDWSQLRDCSIDWGQEAYEQGMSSGQSSFSLTGIPGPDLLTETDMLLWEEGLLYVEEASYPELVVNVVSEQKIPFRVELAQLYDDEYIAWFYFKIPHGASSVFLEASADGALWYSQEEWVGTEFGTTEVKTYMMVRDDADQPVMRPSAKVPYYFRMKVTGSSYSGETDILVVGEEEPPKANDDIDGNRGGVQGDGEDRFSQDEEDRVVTRLAESLAETTVVAEEEMKETQAGQVENESAAGNIDKKTSPKRDKTQQRQPAGPGGESDRKGQENQTQEASDGLAETGSSASVMEIPLSGSESGLTETAKAGDEAAAVSVSSPGLQKMRSKIPGFVAAVAGTAILLTSGAMVLRYVEKRRSGKM